ncbi:class F sortase [Yinghuangia soli]|uniref:Class F sortase n=1 Tax=Yinghuangia soli TaxID=2908204 RepID=A0AA41U6B3_9ACTN|nr:class F sortase [Yinghuangia soli]MCF2530819.1 class F sortase [Yinghuangia soli]
MKSPAAEPGTPGAKRSHLGLVLGALLAGGLLIGNGAIGTSGPPSPDDASAVAAPGPGGGGSPLNRAVPTVIRIPAIAVNARIVGVGVSPQGELDVPPAERNTAGWNTEAVTPGQTGTAVVVGHVDSKDGPAVFYELGRLGKGAKIEIARRDGRTAVFTTYAVRTYDRDDFPATRVYGNSDQPELRVITCGGRFDPGSGYSGNIVVYARLTATR